MCDLHSRLVEHARALGARNVRIEHGGSRGGPRHFRRHPHLTGEINGQIFKFPVKARPRDASRGYRRSYLRALKAHLRAVGGLADCAVDPNCEHGEP
jgi:hypothetical protein